MNVFPMYMGIEDKTFLVVGGGSVAKWKIEVLRRFDAQMIVVAEETDLTESPDMKVIRRRFEEADLDMADFVIAATNDIESDKQIVEACRARRIPVNAVDRMGLCDFYFPSIIKRGPLVLSISTSGTSPAYAQQLRKDLEETIPAGIGGVLERMGQIRGEMMKRVPEQKKRKAAYEEILQILLAADRAAEKMTAEGIPAEMAKEQVHVSDDILFAIMDTYAVQAEEKTN